ncbi:MAG: aminotransferase class I/II-fold pyridoxal phosphate-dependent enzyme, partial [Acidimicrobiaceae bacterium]|nr:aminotransferase class I/II-fold pyridoxal phosphate-dependent enzyme [Acidimicrobiaceae bacterium]
MLSQANFPDVNFAVTTEELSSVLAGWAQSDHGTLARRLAHAIRAAVTAGLLVDGARLPPERQLAQALAVSRSTVTAALQLLRDERIVVSRQGSGSVVRAARNPAPTSRVAQHFTAFAGIDLAAGNPPDPSHWPAMQLDVADLIAEGGGPGVQPLGLVALRDALAARHTEAGLHTDASQIHVTSGGHQAMALVVAAEVGRGDLVAVEDTNYAGIFDIIEHLGARALPVPADRAGMLPDALDSALTEHQPAL